MIGQLNRIDMFNNMDFANGYPPLYGVIFYVNGPTGFNGPRDEPLYTIRVVTPGWGSYFLYQNGPPRDYGVVQLECLGSATALPQIGHVVQLTYDCVQMTWSSVQMLIPASVTPVLRILDMSSSFRELFYRILHWLWAETELSERGVGGGLQMRANSNADDIWIQETDTDSDTASQLFILIPETDSGGDTPSPSW